jgi:C1A family cysteine protease
MLTAIVVLLAVIAVVSAQTGSSCNKFKVSKNCLENTDDVTGEQCAFMTCSISGSYACTPYFSCEIESVARQHCQPAPNANYVCNYKETAVVSKEARTELVLQDPAVVGSAVKTVRKQFKAGELPAALDYRSLGLMTLDLNQHIPVYCGSCWAHSAFSSIADRIKIATGGKYRDVIPSVQALINCGSAGSCNGGDSNAANAWVYKNGIPDVTCQQYQAKNMQCTAINTCMNCDPSNGCYPQTNYTKIYLSEYGSVTGDDEIMAEIYARGPVSAYINANCIETYNGGINMYDTCSTFTTNHAIQLNGWGEENGVQYWIGRNSWGTYWGEHGFFRIVRGGAYKPKTAYWAVPDLAKSGIVV